MVENNAFPQLDWEIFEFKKGKHNQSELVIPKVFFVDTIFQNIFANKGACAIALHPTCWFDWKKGKNQDNDIYDWNFKLWGWSPLGERPNKNGIMLAGRPKVGEKNVFQLCFYQNRDFKAYPIEDRIFEVTIKDEGYQDVILVTITPSSKSVLEMDVYVYDFQGNLRFHVGNSFQMDQEYNAYSEIFLWFGGEDNSPGEFGGVPSSDIKIYADRISWKKSGTFPEKS